MAKMDEFMYCLMTLNFTQEKNPNGGYIVYDDKDIPKWFYDNEDDKEKLRYFFLGMCYARVHDMIN